MGRATSSTFARRRRREGGVALLLTLLVLSILAVVVVQFSYGIKIETTIVRNVTGDEALTVAAKGAIPYIAALFRDDRKNGKTPANTDGLADTWDDPNLPDLRKVLLGDVTLELTIEDLDRRLSLDWFSFDERQAFMTTALQRLLDKLAVDGDHAQIAGQIRDKVRELAGATALPGATGTNAAKPSATPTPTPTPVPAPGTTSLLTPAKRGIFSLDQLLEIDGLDPKVLYGDPSADPPKKGIASFVTCWCTDALNLNTMPAEVLFAILPQHNNAQPQPGDIWASADDVVTAIQKYRIDPLYQQGGSSTSATGTGQPTPVPTPTPAPSGNQAGGKGGGASGSWTGKAFEKVDDLQNSQIHQLLGTIFDLGQGAAAAATPTPTPAAGAALALKTLLAVESHLYAVVVKATNVDGVTKTVRMVLSRNSSDEVAALLVREDPR